MPVQSMTGSGRARGETGLGTLTVELRSVNGRNLGIKTRLPAECAPFEPWIDQRVRATLRRGSVLALFELDAPPGPSFDDAVDATRFVDAARRLQQLAADAGIEAAPSPADVLLVPGVVTGGASRARVSREPPSEIAALCDAALAELVAHRTSEGAACVAALTAIVDELETALGRVEMRLPEVSESYRANLLRRVNEFLADRAPQLEPADVLREVALFADRVDVAEEVQRLRTHITKLRTTLTGDGPVGRALEFLLQEVLREVNTLGSKTPDVEVAHEVVAMKTGVDRMKEQAANLE